MLLDADLIAVVVTCWLGVTLNVAWAGTIRELVEATAPVTDMAADPLTTTFAVAVITIVPSPHCVVSTLHTALSSAHESLVMVAVSTKALLAILVVAIVAANTMLATSGTVFQLV
jgi:malonyl CoA-acyl carrier protein transacylase